MHPDAHVDRTCFLETEADLMALTDVCAFRIRKEQWRNLLPTYFGRFLFVRREATPEEYSIVCDDETYEDAMAACKYVDPPIGET